MFALSILIKLKMLNILTSSALASFATVKDQAKFFNQKSTTIGPSILEENETQE